METIKTLIIAFLVTYIYNSFLVEGITPFVHGVAVITVFGVVVFSIVDFERWIKKRKRDKPQTKKKSAPVCKP